MKFILLLIYAFTLCSQDIENEQAVIHVLPKHFYKLIKNKKTVLDLRYLNNYYQGHIPNVTHMDPSKSSFKYDLLKCDKNEPYFIYDHYGINSKVIANTMKQLGFKKIYVLEGGYISWKEKRLPISKHMRYLVDSIGHNLTHDSTANELTCNCTHERN